MKERTEHETSLYMVPAIVLSLSSFVLYFFILSLSLKVSFIELMGVMADALYVPNFNIFATKAIAGIIPFKWIYHLLIMIICALFLYFLTCHLRRKTFPLSQLKRLLASTVLCFIVIIAGLQQVGRIKTFINETTLYIAIPEKEKSGVILKHIYYFTQAAKLKLSKQHHAIYMTDLEVEDPVNFILRAFLKYHLYPEVVLPIRPDEEKSYDSILIYYKNDSLEAIPEGFNIVEETEDLNLLLVVKE